MLLDLFYILISNGQIGKGIYLSQAYVKEEYRKNGRFKMLLNELELRESDCKFITNLVGRENQVKNMKKLTDADKGFNLKEKYILVNLEP